MKTTALSKEIFRAYDIRGIVDATLTAETVFAIGQALGEKVRESGQTHIVVGRDGRLSGPRLFQALSEGIRHQGIHVVNLGQVPTPVVYFATHHLNIPAGVVITGSHNPAEYNGLKIVLNHGALWGEDIQALYDRLQQGPFSVPRESRESSVLGVEQNQDLQATYLQHICNTVTLSRPLKIVIDSGNGVTGDIAPKLFQKLGAEVISLFCEIDGNFPNHHPDPGHPKNLIDLQQAVLTHQADLGLAFDGDGDRLGVIDSAGNIIWPDRQLILFARDILNRHPGAPILFDVKCSQQVAKEIEKAGGRPLMTKTGHSLIKAKMKEENALLGGEMSGHLFFKERWFGFDDALYAGARLLELFSKESKELSSKAWFDTLPNTVNTPELLIAISEQEKFQTVEKLIRFAQFENAKVSTIDGLRVDFADGFGLVRPSNTSAYLVLRFEGDTEASMKRIQESFRKLLLAVLPEMPLPF